MTSNWDDTIVALATPPGIGAIGVIRMSGPKSVPIIKELFPSKDLSNEPAPSLHIGFIVDDKESLDEAVVSLFRGPRSYTGEDVVEISCHGSPYVHQRVINACVARGARLAKPGEFTQRAFLNGKLDLAQAEAVADLIASNTAASQRAALHTIRGGFSEKLKELRERLIRFSALVELELDFSQEDVEFADRKQFHELIHELTDSTNQLIDSFRLGNVIKNGVSVAIVGKPNAGKSTLLNTLLNENRAIVSEIPGTTRDTIEELLNIDGIIFRLIDTAGIREHTSDTIESAGMQRSLEKMKQADLVLYVFDVNDDPHYVMNSKTNFEKEGINYLLIGNKIDKNQKEKQKEKEDNEKKDPQQESKPESHSFSFPFSFSNHLVLISAREHIHIETLRERMVDAVLQGEVQTEGTVVTNARHYHALMEVQKSLQDIKSGLDNNLSGDLLALDIRRCLHYLGEITGEVSNEDMLDYIFSKFCIGK
jgi:tRNA modification GTPase